MTDLCDDGDVEALVASFGADDGDDAAQVEALIARFPNDPRLHFMLGSLLASNSRPIEAHAALSRAVELAPDFAIARYQLGFFELTSGEVERALSTWGPLLALPESHYLRIFVEGMIHLIRDEFDEAIERMERGIALNQENLPLNADIRLLIDQCRSLADGAANSSADDAGDQSATSFFLNRMAGELTKH